LELSPGALAEKKEFSRLNSQSWAVVGGATQLYVRLQRMGSTRDNFCLSAVTRENESLLLSQRAEHFAGFFARMLVSTVASTPKGLEYGIRHIQRTSLI